MDFNSIMNVLLLKQVMQKEQDLHACLRRLNELEQFASDWSGHCRSYYMISKLLRVFLWNTRISQNYTWLCLSLFTGTIIFELHSTNSKFIKVLQNCKIVIE